MPKVIKDYFVHFNNKIKKVDNSCWEWLGILRKDGYGVFTIYRKQWRAHRYSWFLVNGEIPNGMIICHSCDNRKCVNPEHLWLGTQMDNIRDASRKGRLDGRKVGLGERQRCHKLTIQKVTEIRSLYCTGMVTQKKLAELYLVSLQTIYLILKRKIWKCI